MRTQKRMHIQVKAELDMCKYAIKFIAIPNAMQYED